MLLNFDKLISLHRLVRDIFHSNGFTSCSYGPKLSTMFSHEQVLVPGQYKTYSAYAYCVTQNGDKFREKFKSPADFEWDGYVQGSLWHRSVKSFVIAHASERSVEQEKIVAYLERKYEVPGFLWDCETLENLLLNQIPDADFVIARNFLDYGGAAIQEKLLQANSVAARLNQLGPQSSALLFADMFGDKSDPLVAWLVFDKLFQPYAKLETCDVNSLFDYCSVLLRFENKALTDNVLDTLKAIFAETNILPIKQAISDYILTPDSEYGSGITGETVLTGGTLHRTSDDIRLKLNTNTYWAEEDRSEDLDVTVELLLTPGSIVLQPLG